MSTKLPVNILAEANAPMPIKPIHVDCNLAALPLTTTLSSGEVGLPMENSNLILPCGIFGRWEV